MAPCVNPKAVLGMKLSEHLDLWANSGLAFELDAYVNPKAPLGMKAGPSILVQCCEGPLLNLGRCCGDCLERSMIGQLQ